MRTLPRPGGDSVFTDYVVRPGTVQAPGGYKYRGETAEGEGETQRRRQGMFGMW